MSVNIKTENGLVKVAGKVNSFPVNKISSSDYLEDSPIGTVISFMGTTAPSHYLVCDGTVYNIADYSDLADFIQSQFGSKNYFGGDGTTTFAVPDLRGEFLRGAGTNSHANQGSGANVGVHQNSTQLPYVYSNYLNAQNLLGVRLNADDPTEGNNPTYSDSTISVENNCKYAVIPKNNMVVGDSTSKVYGTTIRPTNTSVLYCIKYESTYFMEVEDVGYSTSETFTGKTWIDGKPIYRRVIDAGYMPNASTKSINHNIENINFVVRYEAFMTDDSDVRYTISALLPNSTIASQAYVIVTKTQIVIWAGSNRSNYKLYVFIEYTKTTD